MLWLRLPLATREVGFTRGCGASNLLSEMWWMVEWLETVVEISKGEREERSVKVRTRQAGDSVQMRIIRKSSRSNMVCSH